MGRAGEGLLEAKHLRSQHPAQAAHKRDGPIPPVSFHLQIGRLKERLIYGPPHEKPPTNSFPLQKPIPKGLHKTHITDEGAAAPVLGRGVEPLKKVDVPSLQS
jgi:hypothetical protein